MKRKALSILIIVLALATAAVFLFSQRNQSGDDKFISYTVDPKQQDIQFYWKDDNNEAFRSIQNLKTWLNKKHKTLLFAMNGGMYKQGNSPQGLYVENGKTLMPLDTLSGNGNFYLKPNGVFYITTSGSPVICTTENFSDSTNARYATQSGPMLVIDGQIHPAFNKSSTNLNIRNGVGILPGNKAVFAMSKNEINFYHFADYFKTLGCKHALYLDGLVSRTYLPGKNWTQTDGDFGVIIGVTKEVK